VASHFKSSLLLTSAEFKPPRPGFLFAEALQYPRWNNKGASIAAPPIAFDAASQPLAIAVNNLDELFPATVALHLSDSS
jgi:hypothetical protein